MTNLADWAVASRVWTTQNPIINDDPYAVSASLGGLYLIYPGTTALDMLAQLEAAMTAGSVGSAAAFITQLGYVRLTGAGVFTIDWTGATVLRDLLGFTGNLAAASAYTAPNRSPLLWSPHKTWTPERSQLDTHGQKVADVSLAIGQGGVMTVRTEGAASVVQRFSLKHVSKASYQASTSPAAGEFTYFWETTLLDGQRWIVVRKAVEGTSATTSATYDSSVVLGPYKADLSDRSFCSTPFQRAEGFGLVEAYYNIGIPAVKTPQFA